MPFTLPLSFGLDVRIEEISDNEQTGGFLVKLPAPIEDRTAVLNGLHYGIAQ